MSSDNPHSTRHLLRTIILAGFAVAILDGVDAIVAFGLIAGIDPVTLYQFVASGAFGPAAFEMGATGVVLGAAFHTLIAFVATAVYVLAATRFAFLSRHFVRWGLVYGVAVYAFMNYVVMPLSRVPESAFSWPLFVNGVVGHALFVGLPIAWLARDVRPHRLAGQRSRVVAYSPTTGMR